MKLCLGQLAGSVKSVAIAALATATMLSGVAATGCGAGMSSRRSPSERVAYTPSADELAAEQRLLTQPFALAVHRDHGHCPKCSAAS